MNNSRNEIYGNIIFAEKEPITRQTIIQTINDFAKHSPSGISMCEDGIDLLNAITAVTRKNTHEKILIVSSDPISCIKGSEIAKIVKLKDPKSTTKLRKAFEDEFPEKICETRVSIKKLIGLLQENNPDITFVIMTLIHKHHIEASVFDIVDAVIPKPNIGICISQNDKALYEFLLSHDIKKFLQKFPNADPKNIPRKNQNLTFNAE